MVVVVVFGKVGIRCIWAKVVIFLQSGGCIRAKVVLFGQGEYIP